MPGVEEAAGLDFADVYRRHADPVFRYCLSQLHDRAAAEDVAADVFASAFDAHRKSRVGADGVRPWLFRIARNATIDHRRRSRTGIRLLARLRREPGAGPPGVEMVAATREELRQVLAAIARLRARDRQLVGLRVAACLSYAQIAEVLGMNENAARMATQRAIQRVRAELGNADG